MPREKPLPTDAEVSSEHTTYFSVTITYEDGSEGELEVKKDPDRRFNRKFEEYAYPLVFGRHHWFDQPEERYEELKDLIRDAIEDYREKQSAGG